MYKIQPTFGRGGSRRSENEAMVSTVGLTMRLSDAGLRRRPTKLFYPNHRPPPWLNEDATPRSLEPIVRFFTAERQIWGSKIICRHRRSHDSEVRLGVAFAAADSNSTGRALRAGIEKLAHSWRHRRIEERDLELVQERKAPQIE
jgi:hypothetical protein